MATVREHLQEIIDAHGNDEVESLAVGISTSKDAHMFNAGNRFTAIGLCEQLRASLLEKAPIKRRGK